MNDFAGPTLALLASAGIGDLPPVVQPDLMRDGRLVEVMPKWRFRSQDLSLVHLGNRHMPGRVRLFKEFAARVPTLQGLVPQKAGEQSRVGLDCAMELPTDAGTAEMAAIANAKAPFRFFLARRLGPSVATPPSIVAPTRRSVAKPRGPS